MPVCTGMTNRVHFRMLLAGIHSTVNPGKNTGSSFRLPGGGREPGINKYWMPVCTGMTKKGKYWIPAFAGMTNIGTTRG